MIDSIDNFAQIVQAEEMEYIEKEFEYQGSRVTASFPKFPRDSEKATMRTVRQMLINSYVLTKPPRR